MRKMRFKKKNIVKKVTLGLLGLGVIGGCFAIGNSVVDNFKSDTKGVLLTYDVGSLSDTTGKYVKDENKLYTKKAFECDGLVATLDFDNEITYSIAYYDILDNFISMTEELTDGYSGIAPINGAYARIQITPTNDEDEKISFFEKYDYGSQLNVEVSKNAKENLSTKFTSYKGSPFQIVNNLSDSVFIDGYNFTIDDGVIPDVDRYSTTSTTLFKINDYKKISFDFNDLSDDLLDCDVSIFEFDNINLNDANINTFVCMDNFGDYNFNINTEYIIINIFCDDSTLLQSMPSCFILEK